jgi:hypothetical protein
VLVIIWYAVAEFFSQVWEISPNHFTHAQTDALFHREQHIVKGIEILEFVEVHQQGWSDCSWKSGLAKKPHSPKFVRLFCSTKPDCVWYGNFISERF